MTKVIHTKTQEQFNQVMEIFEKKGWNYFSSLYWKYHKENTGILYDKTSVVLDITKYTTWTYEIITFQQFLLEEGIIRWVMDGSEKVLLAYSMPTYIPYRHVVISKFNSVEYLAWGIMYAYRTPEIEEISQTKTISISTQDNQTIEISEDKATELWFIIKPY